MALELSSPAFRHWEPIPKKYVRDGDNISPPLNWRGAPPETKSFALIVEDPDAPSGTFGHWAIYDLPAERMELAENAGRQDATTFREAVNDFGSSAYDGPQPPPGHGVHHYHFRLAALDIDSLDVPVDAHVRDILKAAAPHVLDETELVGTFQR
ncbi:MAG TPA: YbhB/YbcL family Raf kinase inhibitor-like protein [Vitreimonas sp.]|uniref:YbhB/YbcL family Raf kinase inhibitor-like protein n=1 Tax=Vitreimonas sp. TaxID=3069702 RepID=UPI002D491E6F|nr:YbhB/YbcL family Raf kinase inhibitor-like protein [Vitreimonas sp.]HYD89288.1 YbhB/YbcL family Raf kinase inhibitor-like protein [Vitreimonas sp.]